jgi:Zn-dependent protease with chaperone function
LSWVVLLSVGFAGRLDAAQAERVDERPITATTPTDPELVPVPVPEPSAKALRFHRGNNLLWVINEAWALVVPGIIAFSGFSARIRNLARRLGRGRFFTIGIYVVLYLCLIFLADRPLAYYQGYVRLHEYGLSNQTFVRWLRNGLVALLVASTVGICFTWVPYLLLERSPRRWWLYTSVLAVPFMFAGMFVMPIWIDPLFNDFGPMKDKALENSILALAEKANIQGSRVYEIDKSVDTNAVNAYVTGFLGSKRIVLWDTLIAKLEKKELLCVMAHEMGHYVLGHVVRSILLSSLAILVGLYLVDRMGHILVARFSRFLQFERLSDVASVPLLMMLIQANSLILSPAVLAYSRYQEHEADRYALDLTHANHSAAMAFAKLQEENLGVPRPSWLYVVFRSTHPSIGERIDFCNAYRPRTREIAPGSAR